METLPSTQQTSISSKKNVKVFIVDDDPMYRQALEHRFKKMPDYQVYLFKTGEECLRYLKKLNPNILVLDYCLNSLPSSANGLEILKKVKRIKPQISILMLSAQENLEIAKNCIRYGAFDYIIKSNSAFIRLHHLIQKILNNLKLQKQAKEQENYFKLFIAIAFVIILTPGVVYQFIPEITPWLTIVLFIGFAVFFSVVNRKKIAIVQGSQK